MKMLICDDDPMTMRALEFQFKKEGFQIVKACDGREASKILKETEDIDVMITDVFMPYVNGLELVTFTRKILHRIFPIIIVSRASVNDNIEQAMELGANEYIIKPINLDDISAKVKNLLNKDDE